MSETKKLLSSLTTQNKDLPPQIPFMAKFRSSKASPTIQGLNSEEPRLFHGIAFVLPEI